MHFVEIFPVEYSSIKINLDLINYIEIGNENEYFPRYFSITYSNSETQFFFENKEDKKGFSHLIDDFDKIYNNLLKAIEYAQRGGKFERIMDLRRKAKEIIED